MGEHRTPIEIAIDNACKYDPDAESMPDFLSFVLRESVVSMRYKGV